MLMKTENIKIDWLKPCDAALWLAEIHILSQHVEISWERQDHQRASGNLEEKTGN